MHHPGNSLRNKIVIEKFSRIHPKKVKTLVTGKNEVVGYTGVSFEVMYKLLVNAMTCPRRR